jgi:leader peptidase (prepilin peptidase)/N-methyltransferase
MEMNALYLLAGILGLIIGSMLNALVWRTREERSMWENHSVCPHCQHALTWFDLFPVVSYILLRGCCRYCRESISWQYPLVELVTGITFIVVVSKYMPLIGSTADWWLVSGTVYTLVSTALFITLFVYDFKWYELPNEWTLSGAVISLVMIAVAVTTNQSSFWQPSLISGTPTLLPSILSGIGAALFFLLIVVGSEKILKKEGMGWGDVKLGLFMGLFLGFPGIVVALYLAFILGAVLSLVLIATKRKSFGQTVPFGPFLIAGTFLAWWFTPLIVSWYQTLL